MDLKTESPTEINPLFYCLLMRVNQTKNGGFDSKTEKIKDSTPAYGRFLVSLLTDQEAE